MQKLQSNNPEQLVYDNGLLVLSVLGGIKLEGLDRMRVTLKAEIKDHPRPPMRHNLDLYNDNQLEKLIRKAAEKLEIGTSVIAASLAELTQQLEEYRLHQIKNQQAQQQIKKQLTENEVRAARAFMEQPDLLERTNTLIGQSGVIGEELNRLLMYLIFTSRKREQPLHVISLGSSGTGKTHLQEKTGQLIPEEERIEITTLSENAFYYFGQRELKNRLILIEDLDGAENVLYPMRELMSKRKISKTIAHKTTKGETKTIHLVVEGPVSVAGCTTRESIYEDNANRSFLLYLDESKQQDEKIMQYQRALSAGRIDQHKEQAAAELLRNCQRILEPVKVINPYAETLKIPGEVFKPRRSNAHYLAFIEVVTFYHQYQREQKADENTGEIYIETTLEDIAAANRLLKETLLRKSDELSGACRNFFESLKMYLLEEKKQVYTSKEIRSKLRLPGTTFRRYQNELFNCGYVKVRSGKQATGYQYEVVSYEEYNTLRSGIETVLDNILKQLQPAAQLSPLGGNTKEACATTPAVSHSQNGSPNKQQTNQKAPVSQPKQQQEQGGRKRIEEAEAHTLDILKKLLQQEPQKMFSALDIAEQSRRSPVTEGRYLKELCEAGILERLWKNRQYLYTLKAA